VIAQKLANTYAATFVNEQQQQNAAQVQAAERLVNAQYNALNPAGKAAPQGLALADRAQSLAVLAKLGSATVTLAGTASRPSYPSSPNVKRDALLGAVLGLLIGLVIAFLLERFDPRIRDPKDLEAVYELPLLAAVPKHREYKVLETLEQTSPSDQLSPYDEVFKLLRSYLRYYAVDRELRTLLVISADPGEGKTTTCYNLAKAAAVLGSRVLLIEGDLRHTSPIGPLLGKPDATLPDVLSGHASMLDALHAVPVGPKTVLDVLVAGNVPPANAGELIGSEAMDFLLAQASDAYDLVVIDTPPLSLVADAVPLLTKVDGVIVIGRMGKSRHDAAEQLRDKLIGLRAPVLGVVANQVRASEATGYRRRYGYGYGYRDRPQVPSTNGSGSLNGAARTAGSTPPASVTPPGDDE
jgi:capsular exopolysaccharide synthesis family protein